MIKEFINQFHRLVPPHMLLRNGCAAEEPRLQALDHALFDELLNDGAGGVAVPAGCSVKSLASRLARSSPFCQSAFITFSSESYNFSSMIIMLLFSELTIVIVKMMLSQ